MTNIYHDRIPQLFAHFEENQDFYLVQELIAALSGIIAIVLSNNSERLLPIIHQKCDRPSYIRVNQRPSAVKKDRSPFLTIQKSDRSTITYNSNQSLFQRLDIYILKPSQFFDNQLFLNCRNNRLNHRRF